MDDLALRICIVAQKAGSEIMSVRESFKPEEFELKGDGSPVTVADLRAHQIIEETLSKIHPEIPIVSEEGSVGDPLSSETVPLSQLAQLQQEHPERRLLVMGVSTAASVDLLQRHTVCCPRGKVSSCKGVVCVVDRLSLHQWLPLQLRRRQRRRRRRHRRP